MTGDAPADIRLTVGMPKGTAIRDLSASANRYGRFHWMGLAAALLIAVGTRLPAVAQAPLEPKPDFLVRDVNSNSPRNGQAVSPRDYRLQISAFYFGAAG